MTPDADWVNLPWNTGRQATQRANAPPRGDTARRTGRAGRGLRAAGFVLRRSWPALVALLLWTLGAGCSRQADYPNRPITLICPWSPGGGTDLTSREVAALLERELGVPVNVINATGGGGVTGHTRGALARPDGYTLTMITVELNMLHWRGLTSISYRDYQPLVLLNRDAAALFVRDDAPWQTAADLLAHVRAHPGELRTSGTARGGIWHLALAGWLQAAGLKPTDAIWVSINGAGPSLQELMAGGVQVVCCSVPEARSLLDAGRVRCLGVMADERLPDFPHVPTMKEQGIAWSMGGWRGVAVPAGTPAPIVQKLATALDKIVHGEDYVEFTRRTGFNWSYEAPDQFAATLARLDGEFGKLLTSEAFRPITAHTLGPMAFPTLLALLGLGVTIALLTTRQLGRDPQAVALSRAGLLRCAQVIGWVVAYMALAETLGFILTAGALLMLLLWRGGVRWPLAAAISVVLVPLLYQLFAVLLRVPLPRGVIGW